MFWLEEIHREQDIQRSKSGERAAHRSGDGSRGCFNPFGVYGYCVVRGFAVNRNKLKSVAFSFVGVILILCWGNARPAKIRADRPVQERAGLSASALASPAPAAWHKMVSCAGSRKMPSCATRG